MGLKDIKVVLTLTQEAFNKGIDLAVQKVNSLDKAFKSSLQSTANLSTRMQEVGQSAAIGFVGLAGTIAASMKAFGDFENGMANIATVVNTNTESIGQMGQKILQMSTTMPVSINDLTAGLYDLRSAGIGANEAFNALEISSKLSVAGLSSVAEATDIMSSAMNAFRDEGLSAAQIGDILFKGVEAGKMTISQMAQAFGATAPLIHNAGVSLADFTAGTAALTQVGIPASVAQTQLRSAIESMINPGKEMTQVFQKLGVASGTELIQKTGSMGAAFTAVGQAAEALGIPLSKVVGRVEGSTAMMTLGGSAAQAYADTLVAMGNSAGVLDEAYNKKLGTFMAQLQIFMNSVQKLAIDIGTALAPTMTVLTKFVTMATNGFSSLPTPVKQVTAALLLAGTALTGLIAAFGLIVAPMVGNIANLVLFATKLAAIPAIATTVGEVIATVVAVIGGFAAPVGAVGTAVTAVISIITGIGPVIAGIVATAAALYVAWQTNFLGIQDVTAKVVDAVTGFFSDMGESATSIWENISIAFKQSIEFIKIVFNDLKTFFKPGLDAISNTFKAWYQNISNWASEAWTFIANGAAGLFNAVSSIASQGFGAVASFCSGMAKQVSNIFNSLVLKIADAMRGLVKAANFVLAKMGKQTIDVDGIVASVKSATDKSVAYVQTTWQKAGAVIKSTFKAPAAAIGSGVASKINTSPLNSPGSGGGAGAGDSSNAGSEQKKAGREAAKSEREAEKQSAHDLAAITDIYTQSLKENSIALDEGKAKLSEYTGKGAELALELDKLKKDQQILVDAQKQLAAAPTKGQSTEEKKLQGLQEIKNKLEENKVAQMQTEREITQNINEENKKRVSAQLSYNKTELEGRNQLLTKQGEFEIAHLDQLLADKKITEEEYINQVGALKEAQYNRDVEILSLEKTAMEEKYKAMLEAKGFEDAADAESLAMKTQLLELQNQLNMRTLEYGQSLQTMMQGATDSKKGDKVGLQGVFQSVQESFDTMIGSLITGTAKASEAFANMGKQIVNSLVGKAFKFVTDGLFKLVGEWLLQHTIMGKISDLFAKKSAKTAQASNVASATTATGVWATRAASAVAGIPIIGPSLAAAAAAAATAQGMAIVGTMKAVSFDVGTPNVAKDMLANIHAGETIIPKSFASAIRSGELTLSGPGNKPAAPGGNGGDVHISFAGATFMGNAVEMVNQIERLLVSKSNLYGSAIQFRGA